MCAVQRSCRRRRRSTRWSTTSSTPRSPNSLASRRCRRRCQSGSAVVGSARLLYSTAPSLLLLSPAADEFRRITSRTTRFTTNENYCGAFTTPRESSCLRLYFAQENFFTLYFIIILWELKSDVCRSILKLYLTSSRASVRILWSALTLRPAYCCRTVD